MNHRQHKLTHTVFFLIALFTPLYSHALSTLSPENSGRLFAIKGSNTIGAELAPKWVVEFLEKKGAKSIQIRSLSKENEYRVTGKNGEKDIYVDIYAHGSSTGFSALNENEADIAMSSRPIRNNEVKLLQSYGDMTNVSAEHIVAIDGLAVIVNKHNPLIDLTLKQISDIFSGEVTNWSQIGGANQKISVYARDNNSGTWDTFNTLVLKNTKQLTSQATRFESNDHLADRVAQDTSGIGFVGLASTSRVKTLGISDQYTSPLQPQPLYVATEDYPLSRRLFMYTPEKIPLPIVEEFIHYVKSSEGQAIAQQIGFISLNPISQSAPEDMDGPDEYLSLVKNSERLSINFRFRENSAQLDNKAKQDILRLVSFIQLPQNKNKRIQLIGFGDLKQNNQRAIVLSKLRATTVKSALYDHGVITDAVVGFGPFMPVASHIGSGKSKNQRVEVWFYDETQRDINRFATR
ncbi:substrate-binding domain-containing protein [Teredinibacter sp. KSP-S5-2]|uniref:substrate-binding domain-containing protein n=1 Tax=Teredinibacter sp. KSP-S5-2 TaxID=3034506 RepID=UPI00293417C0|nr:substrate-binding domain-containing protein [Teredinibacter sp. KSP-S5-2]WNO08096.1 substrate-binding domain-containing protein [Teredinibacter sp. KSP-S5-2]